MVKMIIYFYLLIPLACRLAESSTIKGGNHRNDLVPFLSSRPDTPKENSLKIVSNEPFIIEFQVPTQTTENVNDGSKGKDKKKKRSEKKRVSKIKPLRKKIRKRRSVFEEESRRKSDQPKKRLTESQSKGNKTRNSLSRQEMLKALNMHAMNKETKKVKSEGMRSSKDTDKTDVPSRRNLLRDHPLPSPHPNRDPHHKMIYPNTPKSDSKNYSYKDLIADRERLEQKINYIKSMLYVNNDTLTDDAVRVRRKSDSDQTANKIAKMFLTLSAVNGLHDKKSKCHDDDDDRTLDIWEKNRKRSPSRQSSSSNEERYKVKKWIEYMKSKRSSSKTCPCMSEYSDDHDVFPLEQRLASDYQLTGSGASSEETSDTYRDTISSSRGKTSKSGYNRNNNKEDPKNKLKALSSRGRKKYESPIDDDLELYRSRAKQILKNAEEILDKIKEEEEKRLAAPHAVMSRLRELTSRIQGDPRNSENDLIKIIQKNLGWGPQAKSQSDTDNNSFVDNMKSLILEPYEKAKALTDESTKKLSSYLLRNLGKIDSSEEQEEATGKSDQSPQVYHGQVPQTEEMFSANLAKENPEWDSMAKERAEHQNWSDTLSAILGGNYDDVMKKENTQDGELKQITDQEDPIKRRMEDMFKEQEKKISEYIEKPVEEGESTVFDLMAEGQNTTPEEGKQSENSEKVAETFNSEKQENVQQNGMAEIPQDGVTSKESDTVKLTPKESGSDVTASDNQETSDDQTAAEEFDKKKTISGKVYTNHEDESQDVKASVNEDLSKRSEAVSEYLQNKKDPESVKAEENQEEKIKDVVIESPEEFKEGTGEIKEQSYKAQKMQDDNVESKENREENDVLKSKHLATDAPERDTEELEKVTEDIQKPVSENAKELFEEDPGEEKQEGEITAMKKTSEQTSSETDQPDENVRESSSSSDTLQKQSGNASENVEDDPDLENKTPSTGVVQASQNPRESSQYGHSKNEKTSEEKLSSLEGVEEKDVQENSAESIVESENPENSAERIIEKGENDKVQATEKTQLDGEGTERMDDTLKSTLRSEEKTKGEGEEIGEEANIQNNNQEKEILRESLNEAEQEEPEQEPSLRANLEESAETQKSREAEQEETDQPSLRATLEESDETQKSREAEQEETDQPSLRATLEESDETQKPREAEQEETDQEPSLRATLEESDETQKPREAEQEETDQEPSLRATLEESDETQKPREAEQEETDQEPSLRATLEESDETQKPREGELEETDQEPSLRANLEESDKVKMSSEEEVKPDETDNAPSLRATLGESDKMEKSGEAEVREESDQEPSLKASLEESDKEQKFGQSLQKKYLEDEENLDMDTDGGSSQSENPEFKESSREQSVKASEKSEEENEAEQTGNEEANESTSKNADELQDTSDEKNLKATRLENRENEEEPVSAELSKTEETDGADDESPLKSENPKTDTERSNESLMNTSESKEVERAHDESTKENSETEGIVETSKPTADEIKDSEEITSIENENVEEQQKEYLKEKSTEESAEVNKTPKLLMKINGGLGEEITKENENENVEKTSSENDAVESTNVNSDISQETENPKTNEQDFEDQQDTKEMDDNNNDSDINVRSENKIEDLNNQIDDTGLKAGELRSMKPKSLNEDDAFDEKDLLERENSSENDVVEGVNQLKEADNQKLTVGKKKNDPASERIQNLAPNQSKSTLEVPKSIGKIMRDLSGKDKDGYISLTNLNPEKIDHIIDQIDEAEQLNKMESENVDCRKECACADEMNVRSRNIGRYEIAKDFLHWVKDLHLNRVLAD